MVSLKDYFDRICYKSKYDIGDRVTGKWNDIPFMGTIGNDTQLNPIDGPYISVHLDLPIMFEEKINNVIIVKHKNVKKLQEIK
jgi:hypothetical protein